MSSITNTSPIALRRASTLHALLKLLFFIDTHHEPSSNFSVQILILKTPTRIDPLVLKDVISSINKVLPAYIRWEPHVAANQKFHLPRARHAGA